MDPRDPEMPDFHQEDYTSEGFVEWKKGKPVPTGYVEIILRGGGRNFGHADQFDWTIDLCAFDIAWYKLVENEE